MDQYKNLFQPQNDEKPRIVSKNRIKPCAGDDVLMIDKRIIRNPVLISRNLFANKMPID